MLETRNKVQMLAAMMLATAILAPLLLSFGSNLLPVTAEAQEPEPQLNPLLGSFSPDTLAAFGLTSSIDTAADVQFDLEVNKSANHNSLNSGEQIIFTITITNRGPDKALGTLFQDKVPAEMTNVNFSFNTDAVSNGADEPEDKIWLLAPIANGNSVIVTVTGELTSAHNVTVTNEALVSAYNPETETNDANNKSTAQVSIVGYNPDAPVLGPIYLPIIFKAPPIQILVKDDFSDKTYNWPDSNGKIINDCKFGYTGDKDYFIKAYNGQACWIPATHTALQRKEGAFEVEARRRSGDDDKFAYGLYINGKNGDENYYLFWIRPNDSCGWRFIKRYNDNNDHEQSGGCASAINRGSGKNKLKLTHSSDGTISIYVNDELLYSYPDGTNGGSSPLTGTGTGLYVDADSSDIDIGFDNFTIYSQ